MLFILSLIFVVTGFVGIILFVMSTMAEKDDQLTYSKISVPFFMVFSIFLALWVGVNNDSRWSTSIKNKTYKTVTTTQILGRKQTTITNYKL